MGAERPQLSHAEVLGRYVGVFVDRLATSGLEHVCLCPGSRSTPLALAFARHPGIRLWTHLDERSCAYFALGMAKATSSPVAILCSSGTAAVNFAPAVVEAAQSHLPLLVLTADRPQELRDLGANQTIDQVRLYGSAARWFVEMPLPEASEEMLRYVSMVASRALTTSRTTPAGPVHLNFPFREPLVPARHDPQPGAWHAEARPDAAKPAASYAPDLSAYRRGVIVCGPDAGVDGGRIGHLAERLGWPLLAEPLSGARCGPYHRPNVIAGYDSFLRSAALVEELTPDCVLRFGAPATGRPLGVYLQRHRGARQVLVTAPGLWPDPDLTADEIGYGDPADVCVALLAHPDLPRADPAWLAAWRRAEDATSAVVRRVLGESEVPSEPSAIIDLADVIPKACSVFAGNSMPVRDIDSFWPAGDRPLFFYGNRGASGIDGVISTALGVAAVSQGRLVLVIGDLSFYHDMNGLLAAKRHGLNATIVLINNDGGGIFSFLPQNADEEHFETLFGTPHGMDFAPVAQLYGVGFQRVTTRAEYRAALTASFGSDGVNVIEIKTDRAQNLALHQRIWREVTPAVTP